MFKHVLLPTDGSPASDLYLKSDDVHGAIIKVLTHSRIPVPVFR